MDPQDHLALAISSPGEDESWLKPGWLAGSEITPESRSTLVDWLVQVSSYLSLSDVTLHLAVSHLDLVLASVQVEVEEVQLLALACLLVAAKWVEDSVPGPGLLLPLTGGLGTKQDLARLEREVLVSLDWKLTRTTPVVFLHYYQEILGKGRKVVFRLARAVLDLCLSQTWYGTVQPSLLASTALLTASYLLGKGWPDDLAQTTCHHPRLLLPHLARVLASLQGELGEGARDKHDKALAKVGQLGQETATVIVNKVQGEFARIHKDSRGFG